MLGGKIYFETATCHGQEKRPLLPPPPPPPSRILQLLPRNRLFIHQCEICSRGWGGHDDYDDDDDDNETSMTRISRGNEQISWTIQQTVLTNGTMESDYHQPKRHRSIFDRVPRRLQDVWSMCCYEDVLLLNWRERHWRGEVFVLLFEESFVLLRVIIAYGSQ